MKTNSNHQRKPYFHDLKSVFGRLTSNLDFRKLNFFKDNLSQPYIVVGPGSSCVNDTEPPILVDLAKNEFHYHVGEVSVRDFEVFLHRD